MKRLQRNHVVCTMLEDVSIVKAGTRFCEHSLPVQCRYGKLDSIFITQQIKFNIYLSVDNINKKIYLGFHENSVLKCGTVAGTCRYLSKRGKIILLPGCDCVGAKDISFLELLAAMSKNTGASKFRRVDVDQYDDDRFQDEDNDVTEQGPNEGEVTTLLTQYPLQILIVHF